MEPTLNPRPSPPNPVNELAKERNRAAAERTLNAWTGLCLSLIGVGVGFDQLVRGLGRRFDPPNPVVAESTATLVGMGFVTVGLLLLGFALVQRRLATLALEQQDYVLGSVNALNRWAVVAIGLAGVAGLAMVLFLL